MVQRLPPGVAQAGSQEAKVEGGLPSRRPTEERVIQETLPLRTARLLGIAAETSGKESLALKVISIRLLNHSFHRDRLSGSDNLPRTLNNRKERDNSEAHLLLPIGVIPHVTSKVQQ